MKSFLVALSFLFFSNCSLFAQSNNIELAEIIKGVWRIESQMPAVNLDKPEAGSDIDYSKELIHKNDSLIMFNKNSFEIDNNRKGKFEIKGHSLYLNGIKYKYYVHNKDKLNLVRIVNSDLMLAYVLIRKNNLDLSPNFQPQN